MEVFAEELISYSNELILIGILIIAFVSLYSRLIGNEHKDK